ncbi:hypothetical protein N8911_00775 [bacterium]|nr:hypothetical protein [bacterium]MDC1212109.1 hypothetical protein [bacterium]
MDLVKRYSRHTNEELIEIIESPSGDYTQIALDAVGVVIKNRQLSEEDLRSLSREVIGGRIREYLKSFDVINDELEMPVSRLLNTEEVKALFQTEFARFKNESDDMIPDSWQYILAAAFG